MREELRNLRNLRAANADLLAACEEALECTSYDLTAASTRELQAVLRAAITKAKAAP